MAKRLFVAGLAACAVASMVVSVAAAAQQDSPDPASSEGDKAKALVEHVCTACHGLDYVSAQARSVESWTRLVNTMANRGAKATDAEFDQIVTYLAKTYPASPPPAAPAPIQPPV